MYMTCEGISSLGFDFCFIEVIFSAILFHTKSPVASAVFCTNLSDATSIPAFVAVSKSFFTIFITKFSCKL